MRNPKKFENDDALWEFLEMPPKVYWKLMDPLDVISLAESLGLLVIRKSEGPPPYDMREESGG